MKQISEKILTSDYIKREEASSVAMVSKKIKTFSYFPPNSNIKITPVWPSGVMFP